MFWAQKVGDLYEKVTQNKPLEEAMDLHNNAVGRIYFLNLLNKSEVEIIYYLLDKMNDSRKITEIEKMKQFYNEMIFIEE